MFTNTFLNLWVSVVNFSTGLLCMLNTLNGFIHHIYIAETLKYILNSIEILCIWFCQTYQELFASIFCTVKLLTRARTHVTLIISQKVQQLEDILCKFVFPICLESLPLCIMHDLQYILNMYFIENHWFVINVHFCGIIW